VELFYSSRRESSLRAGTPLAGAGVAGNGSAQCARKKTRPVSVLRVRAGERKVGEPSDTSPANQTVVPGEPRFHSGMLGPEE
jgi:hypothetical protein